MNPESRRENLELAREILSVSQLNRAVAGLLQRTLPLVWVSGELSNVMRAASGHWYFSLKDASAQVRAAMFRGRAQYLDFVPRDGDRVEVRAQVTLYEARGEFQLVVEAMRHAGDGDLYRRFLMLKARLQQEGLFDAERKRALPPLPRSVGVITSPKAAALRDVLTTLARRAPQIPVIVYPTPVQGIDAPPAIVAALRAAARRAECDVLLLVRGGGSIEDLWAFNDEAVARAVAACPIPVVCGIGHETDFSIADFAADLRAPTPTAAAAAAVPDRAELMQRLHERGARLRRAWSRCLEQLEQRLDSTARWLRPPSAQWQARALRLDALAQRLHMRSDALARQHGLALQHLRSRLRAPRTDIATQRLHALTQRLRAAGDAALMRAHERCERAAAALTLVSPQAVLDRGYAIVRDQAGRVLCASDEAAPGDTLAVTLARGGLTVQVRARIDDDPVSGDSASGASASGASTSGASTSGASAPGASASSASTPRAST